MKTIILENQSVLDAATQYLGSLEAIFDFCLENEISISDDMNSNDVVNIPESLFKKTEISNHFSEKKIELATGFPLIEEEDFGGIGVMIISQTFIVT